MANSGCLRVSQILVNKASGDSVLQVLRTKHEKKPNCPVFAKVRGSEFQVKIRSKSGLGGVLWRGLVLDRWPGWGGSRASGEP